MGDNILEKILITEEEKNKIKKNSPDTLPLNPTAQGYSGQEVRKRLSKFVTGDKDSIMELLVNKMALIYENFDTSIYGRLIEDDITTEVDYDLNPMVDITFKANLTSLKINIPEDIGHGYYAGVNFTTQDFEFPIVLENNTSFPLKIMKYNIEIPLIQVSAYKTVNVALYCDGVNIYCYYNEV